MSNFVNTKSKNCLDESMALKIKLLVKNKFLW